MNRIFPLYITELISELVFDTLYTEFKKQYNKIIRIREMPYAKCTACFAPDEVKIYTCNRDNDKQVIINYRCCPYINAVIYDLYSMDRIKAPLPQNYFFSLCQENLDKLCRLCIKN